MRTLYTSGTHFDSIRIYVTGDQYPGWKFSDPRVSIELVDNLNTAYWGTNKCHLCKSSAERVIYLDVDVMVLRPIDQIYEGINSDLIARYVVAYYMGKHYNEQAWKDILNNLDLPDYPKYSPGYMIFQNHSHKRLSESWPAFIDKILANKVKGNSPSRFAELDAFSMACSKEQLSHSLMPDHGHRYAMIGESHEDAVVYHLGTPGFYRFYLPIEKEISLRNRNDLPVKRPKFIQLDYLKQRIQHRLKQRIAGNRDLSTDQY